MNCKIEIKNIESVTVATMRYNGPMTEATKYFPNVFKAIKGKSNGAPFFCYYDVDQELVLQKWNYVFQLLKLQIVWV